MARPDRVAYLAPALLATVPAFSVAAGNAAEFTVPQLAASVAILAAFGVLLHLVVARLFRGRTPAQIAAAAAVVVAWLCCAPLLTDRLEALRPIVGASVLGLASIAICRRVLRRGAEVAPLARALGVFAVALVTLGAARMTVTKVAVERLYDRSATVRELTADLPAPRATARPDIYLIILDNLANSQVQRDLYGRSDAAFEDSLRSLGFSIPTETRSNYAWTPLSVASIVNLGHVRGLEDDVGNTNDFGVPYRLVQRNRAARWLHDEAGYTVYLQPSIVFPGTLTMSTPHVLYGPRGLRRLYDAYARNMLLRISLHETLPYRVLERTHVVGAPQGPRLDALLTVAEVAPLPGPKFVIAHSLVAHEPFVFSPACVARSDGVEPWSADRAAYVDAVSCTERLVLRAVRRILKTSARPPVIILQADHGPLSLHPPVLRRPAEQIRPEQARERMGAFGAYLLPGVPPEEVPSTMTPVNVLRFVFRHYLGAPIAPLPDSSYYTTLARPYRFVNVTSWADAAPRSIVATDATAH